LRILEPPVGAIEWIRERFGRIREDGDSLTVGTFHVEHWPALQVGPQRSLAVRIRKRGLRVAKSDATTLPKSLTAIEHF
jgi:hypothetical protein